MQENTDSVQVWQPGDPVAPGVMRLPTADRASYGAECKRQLRIASWAGHVMSGWTEGMRRATLQSCPDDLRAEVETLVKKLWPHRKKRTLP